MSKVYPYIQIGQLFNQDKSIIKNINKIKLIIDMNLMLYLMDYAVKDNRENIIVYEILLKIVQYNKIELENHNTNDYVLCTYSKYYKPPIKRININYKNILGISPGEIEIIK